MAGYNTPMESETNNNPITTTNYREDTTLSTEFTCFDDDEIYTISTSTQSPQTPNMEAHHNYDQAQIGSELFNYNLFSDPTMSFDWLGASTEDIDTILNLTLDQIFTANKNDNQTSEQTALLSPASLAPSSSSSNKRPTKRTQPRTDTSMPFLNGKTGALSLNLARFTPSTTQSPNTNGPRSPSPASRGLPQQDSQTSSNDPSHPQPYVCEHCKAPFRFSRDYWQHKAQAHNDFRFRCQLGCGKGFARHDNLVQHHRESKRHRRSPSPVIDAEDFSRRKKARKASSMMVESEELRFASPHSSSFSNSNVHSDSASDNTSRDAEGDVLEHPEYLRLQREFELLNAKYELLKKRVNTLTEEKEEWEAREYLRRGRGRD